MDKGCGACALVDDSQHKVRGVDHGRLLTCAGGSVRAAKEAAAAASADGPQRVWARPQLQQALHCKVIHTQMSLPCISSLYLQSGTLFACREACVSRTTGSESNCIPFICMFVNQGGHM